MKSEVALVTMVPTEDELESMGEVGVEMLDGKVASEETVRVCLPPSMLLIGLGYDAEDRRHQRP